MRYNCCPGRRVKLLVSGYGTSHILESGQVAANMPGGEGENRVGEGIQSLKQLHALPWDEKTENEMLRSRLDEQSQLICMLKQRADETQIKWQHLERVNGELERQSGEAAQRFQSERERGERLEERFAILASNHQQMIRFKDEYKQQNEELRQLCDTMRESKYPELLHRDRCIQELRDQLGDTETRLKEQEMNYGRKLDTLKAKVEQLEGEKRTGSLELGDLTHRLKVSEETRHEAQEKLARLEEIKKAEKAEADKRLEEIKKEKQELLNLCMERGRTLQDRQREAAELSVRLQEAQKSLEKAEESYQRDKAAVDADIRVSDLQRKLEDGENQFEQLRRDFEAYKKHSGDLLTKERELNSKLRHLIG